MNAIHAISAFRASRWYRFALLLAATATVVLLWRAAEGALGAAVPRSSEDHWRYWAAWHLAFRGADPYSAQALESVRHAIPGLGPQPAVLFTPPWALPLVTPFALLPYEASRVAWFLASISLVLGSVAVLWRFLGGPRRSIGVAFAVAMIFPPTLLMLRQGQIDPWIVAGVAGFLYWTEVERRDALAGLCLALASVKPQLLAGVWVACALWVVERRRWRVAVAFVGAIVASTLVVVARDPNVVSQFLRVYTSGAPARWATPTAGYYLRSWLGVERFWLQFLAPSAVVIGSAWYWARHRATWTWTAALPVLLWASVLGSTYAWTYDQVVLLGPILAATVALVRNGWNPRAASWMAALIALNVATLLLHRVHTDEFFIWLAPALLAWCWGVRRATMAEADAPPVEAAT
jgi:hypothetical protein